MSDINTPIDLGNHIVKDFYKMEGANDDYAEWVSNEVIKQLVAFGDYLKKWYLPKMNTDGDLMWVNKSWNEGPLDIPEEEYSNTAELLQMFQDMESLRGAELDNPIGKIDLTK